MTAIVIQNMAKTYYIPTIILLFLACYSCKPQPYVNHNSLFGDWQWVQQTDAGVINGTPYDTLTPTSTGEYRSLIFHDDSTYASTITKTGNQNQFENGNFRMKQVLTPGGPVTLLDFIHNGVDSAVNHTLRHDSLIISYPHISGKYTVNIYARVIPM